MKIISIEGADGVGKSTQARKLVNYLRDKGFKVHYEHFPRYNCKIGSLIGDILSGKVDMPKFEAMQMLYVADQVDYSDEILRLAENKYDYLILDRYYLSTIVYSCTKLNNCEMLPTVLGWQTKIIHPHLTIVMEADETINEKDSYKELDEFEKDTTFMKDIKDNYVFFASVLKKHKPIELIDAHGSIDDVFDRIKSNISKWGLI